jgi:large subunit ribosomal protein L15
MPVNKRSKYRGSRTCGGGTHKNRRGAGSRGGRGRAGQRDHRITHYMIRGDVHNGKHGFSVRRPTPTVRVADIGLIDQLAEKLIEEGVATRSDDAVVIDVTQIGIDKILGSGQVTQKMQISAKAFSENAKRKIEEMGGQALIAE